MTSKGDVLLAGRIAGDDVTVAIDAEGDIVMPGIVATHGTVELPEAGARWSRCKTPASSAPPC